MEPLCIRELREGDWPAVLDLANQSVAHIAGAGPQDEWLRNRRSFDPSRGIQYQVIAEASGNPVGYGALESQSPAQPQSFRLFVVTPPRLLATVGEHLYGKLHSRLGELSAAEAWFREYASDASFIEFVRRRGFSERKRFVLQGTELIILANARVDGAAAA